ncbi:hypothetical protein FB45DRAFT_879735 [Roridomyces roridus]|uniref:Tc1-like transposase DDE domain-containing protein n=1 Tax=Roridomyces roridus TaxID=1738132 RepID=A0AAD7AZS1_9AGAR|nr:hypothetical protein FB45DRAFT_879735 [Roridomyces roridus]
MEEHECRRQVQCVLSNVRIVQPSHHISISCGAIYPPLRSSGPQSIHLNLLLRAIAIAWQSESRVDKMQPDDEGDRAKTVNLFLAPSEHCSLSLCSFAAPPPRSFACNYVPDDRIHPQTPPPTRFEAVLRPITSSPTSLERYSLEEEIFAFSWNLIVYISTMGNRRISRDVKIAAINLWEHGQLSLNDILACVGFSRATFFRVLRLWRETGDVERAPNHPGGPRLLHHDDLEHLLLLVRENPDWFLDELLDLLANNRFISVHFTTIHRELERAGMSTKILKEIAEERSELTRLDYCREISQYPADYLGFMDETSKNDKTPGRRRGRAKKGKRAYKRRKLVQGRRLTATGLLTCRGMLTSTVVEGSMHRDQFLEFMEHQVIWLD